ncbi:SAM-dependent methyltransferase [Enterococcus florum]|uniref:SAM-dependent methyltransferase n=1 Tax=Enterococcus florum TaxID=2480627 RepID=A0A4P5PHD1_9ENTE|nr:class I SAM-dependent rRNA methyltransferase [Enterococcus florum]GCF95738.1 SAM-dependent methyltransferase [Enterococcus florum]
MEIELRKNAVKRIRSGNPLLVMDDLMIELTTFPKKWITFVDQQKKYVAAGYLGKQNKGIGWILDREQRIIDVQFLTERFQQALQRRRAYFNDAATTAFRLFNGEGDGIGGLTIDYYDGFLVLSWYNETIYDLSEAIITALNQVCPHKGMVEKIRFKSERQESRWLSGEKPAEPFIIQENGVNYAVYLDEGYMTGIFLDQREVRNRLIEGLAAGQKVLNMFSYTGAFSVAAAIGGASETTSVDLAQRSLPKTAEQFEVNGIPLDNQKIVVMDTFEYFRYAARKGLTYDVIILDPPSFARNKKKTFSVLKDYGRLIEQGVELLNRSGKLIVSTNAANFPIQKFKQVVEASLKEKDTTYQLVEEYRLPPDFAAVDQLAESNYLKVLFYDVKKKNNGDE